MDGHRDDIEAITESSSRAQDGYDSDTEVESSDDDYLNMFDREQFMRDGHDIRFQLPSQNPEMTLSRNMEDLHRKATTIRRRKTKKSILRRKSTKPPTLDRTTKPKFSLRSKGSQRRRQEGYDVVDGASPEEEENLVTSEEQYGELNNIRALTLPMGKKRDYKEQLEKCRCVEPVGVNMAMFTLNKKWHGLMKKMNEVSYYANIGRSILKEIEGQFGAGIMEYFNLVKWLIFLNLLLALTMLPILIPQLVVYPHVFVDKYVNMSDSASQSPLISQVPTASTQSTTSTPTSNGVDIIGSTPSSLVRLNQVIYDDWTAYKCSATYRAMINQSNSTNPTPWYQHILDFVQGTGLFEDTELFYGHYFNKTYNIILTSSSSTRTTEVVYPWYNTSVAYLLSIMFFFLISLLFLVLGTSSGLESTLLDDKDKFFKTVNQVFAGWDFGLYKEKSVRVKKSLIRHELTRYIAEQRREEQYQNRSKSEKIKLHLVRLVVNLLIIAILVGCAAAVYFAQRESDNQLQGTMTMNDDKMNPFLALFWQYLPSVLITIMYAVFPIIFKKLAALEKYYPATEQNVTIARIVLLRLGTVFLLLAPIYTRVITCRSDTECGECDNIYCWETFIGQQLYKLVLLDFFVIVAVVFIVEFPRKLIVTRFPDNKCCATIGQEEFDIPVNVMDIVYTQTLCWVGAFYSPLLPIITFFKVIIFFFLRKLSLFRNQKPAATPYRASSMNLFFKVVLSVALFLSILAVGVSIGVIPPSKSCGPFRTHSTIETPYTMFGSVKESLLLVPAWFRDTIMFLSSPAFIVALIVALLLSIYVYVARSSGQNRLIELLRDTLKREEKDKHWLLTKVNNTLRQELASNSHLDA